MDDDTKATYSARWLWRAIAFAAGYILACLLTGCGLTGGALWNVATNVVSQADGGTTTTTTSTTSTTTVPPVESAYRLTRVTASMIYWTGPDLPDSWKDRRAEEMRDPVEPALVERAGGPCCGEVHLKSSKGRAKFDHLRRNSRSRDWVNIHGGYGMWKQWGEPANGEACELWAVPYSASEGEPIRIGEFKWVR